MRGPAPSSKSAAGSPRSVAVEAALLLALLRTAAAPAGAQLAGAEFQVNTYTTDSQAHSAVASDPAGGFIVVWDSETQDGWARGVRGRRFDPEGAPLGGEFPVNTYTTLAQGIPAVAADGGGNFVVTWTSYQQDGNAAGVFAQRFAAGVPQGEFQVNSFTTSDQKGVGIAADASGDTALVWWSVGQDGSDAGIYTRRYDGAGLPVLGEQLVNVHTNGIQWTPAVAALGGDEFVVTWASYGQDGSGDGIFARLVDAAGLPAGAEIPVNSFTTGSQNAPSVAADAAGGFVVVWASAGQDGSAEGVFGQRFDAAGAPQGGEFRVNVATLGVQREPAVAADADGGFLVTWQGQDGGNYGVFGRYLSETGTPASGEFRVNTSTSNYQMRPAVAAAGAGEFLVVWESAFQDGSGVGVYGQRALRGLFLDSFDSADVCAWSLAVGGGSC